MDSLEKTLAALLQSEVDKRVAAVQSAADAWVQAFREQAGRLVREPASAVGIKPGTAPVVSVEAALPLSVMEEERAAALTAARTYVVTDNSASASNMAPLHLQHRAS